MAPLLALAAFAASGAVIWLAYGDAREMAPNGQPPLIQADATPLKRSPDDPGGRAVAELGGVGELLIDQPDQAEERLLPRPEQPVAPPAEAGERTKARAALEALVSEIRSDRIADGDVGVGGPNSEDPVNFPSPARPSFEPSPAESSVAGSNQPSEERRAVTAATARPAETSAPEPQPNVEIAVASPTFKATPGGRYRVQLAAVREEADAKRAWAVFQEHLGPFISGLQPFFERADTSNGVFYRVQVGPFGETSEADQLCVELKKQDASCFVVTR
jgi:cell division septation protein DedD